MANRATLTNDDLEQISQASDNVLKKVRQKQEGFLSKGNIVSFDDLKKRKGGNQIKNDEIITGELINLDEYRKKKGTEVEREIDRLCKSKTEELGGDDSFENALNLRVKEMVVEDKIETNRDQIEKIKKIIIENSENTSELSAEVEAKKIVLQADSLQENHIDEVRKIKAEEFTKKFEEEAKKANPEITDDQLKLVNQYADLINQVYDGGLEKWKKESIEANTDVSTGKLVSAWDDVEGLVGLLKKTPEEFEKIQDSYRQIRKGFDGLTLPFEKLSKLSSFERVMNSLQNSKLGEVFELVQGGGWMQRVDRLTGGWLNRTIIETTGKFVSKIGNQAAREFIQNSVGILVKEGFNNGLRTILSGVLKGGVQAAGQAAASGAATGAGAAASGAATSASVPVIGWIVAAAILAYQFLVKPILKRINNFFKNIGVSLGIKDFFQDTFGKFLGGIFNFIFKTLALLVGLPALLAGLATTAITPVVIAVFAGFFGYQTMQDNLVSSLVPPVETTDQSNTSTTESSDGTTSSMPGSDNAVIPGATSCSVAEKVVLTGQCRGNNRNVPMRADGRYSGRTICTSGCGPTATSEILQGQNKMYTPKYLMSNRYLTTLSGGKVDNPYYNTYSGNGTTMSMARTTLMRVMGSGKVTTVKSCSVTTMKGLICQGMAVLVHMRYGNGGGHYAVAVAADNNGNIWIKDNGNASVNIYPGGSYYKRSGGKKIDYCFGVKVK